MLLGFKLYQQSKFQIEYKDMDIIKTMINNSAFHFEVLNISYHFNVILYQLSQLDRQAQRYKDRTETYGQRGIMNIHQPVSINNCVSSKVLAMTTMDIMPSLTNFKAGTVHFSLSWLQPMLCNTAIHSSQNPCVILSICNNLNHLF